MHTGRLVGCIYLSSNVHEKIFTSYCGPLRCQGLNSNFAPLLANLCDTKVDEDYVTRVVMKNRVIECFMFQLTNMLSFYL